MPKLLQSELDNHFYTRKGFPGLGIATYQIEREGVEVLLREGVRKGGEIPSWLWKWLESEGFAWTHGTGLTAAASVDLPLLGEQSAYLPLAISTDEDGWHLTVLLPEIPADWLTDLARQPSEAVSVADRLARCRLQVAGSAEVVATDLWPGRGGCRIDVMPTDRPYEVIAKGIWPSEWDLSRWTCGAAGLDSNGTFFRSVANDGVRLGSNAPFQLGDTYLLMGQQFGRALRSIDLLVRAGGQVRELATWGKWRLLETTLPEHESPLLREWCKSVDRKLSLLPWRLIAVSPPAVRYLVDGTPVFRSPADLVVAAIPLSETAAKQPMVLVLEWEGRGNRPLAVRGRKGGVPIYISLQLRQPGHGRIRHAQANHLGTSSPLRFWVESPSHSSSELDLRRPAPIGITVTLDEHVLASLQPWEDGIGPHQILLPPGSLSKVPQVSVQSAVPLNLAWCFGNRRGRRSLVPAEDLDACIASDLHSSLLTKEPFWLQLDAGAFGTLEIVLQPYREDALQDATKGGMPSAKQSAMLPWLAAVAPAYARRPGTDRWRGSPVGYAIGSVATESPWGQRLRIAGRVAAVLRTYVRHLDSQSCRSDQ